MAKFLIKTLGCKVNQSESDSIYQSLKKKGFTEGSSNGNDLCLINTCAVTGKAAMQSRQAIRQIIRSNPDAKIIVSGCYAQIEPEILKNIEGVHQVVSQSLKHKIDEVTSSYEFPNKFPSVLWDDILNQKNFEEIYGEPVSKRSRPFLKIQDGCSSFCSYCVVPYTRGKNRSMPVENVLDHIQKLSLYGYKEIVLTGIHLGSYGKDIIPQTSFFELLQKINNLALNIRIRLSSIEPMELTDDIIRLVVDSNIFCKHFHIPLQSGDDTVLQNMHRPYKASLFKDMVEFIHKLMPDACIGTDVLVGFPGETEDAFNNTRKFIEELPISYLHVFPFSFRPLVRANNFEGKISEDILKKRASIIRKIGAIKKEKFLHSLIGKTYETFIETKRDVSTGQLKGISTNYAKIFLKGDDIVKNSLIYVNISNTFDKNFLIGKFI
ncbi:MAG: tRNA (N(6)-L-threonylcarbamoyladenosine(37)-C(2))-methylthiotransferase MtaB [Desulfobacterales bacterium]|nr:tRNA (N(6)-L-threonylcarbamoyladenosine(37)-C(2))-methylthiotransferase MtaB [Desulfobacterales bacterium]